MDEDWELKTNFSAYHFNLQERRKRAPYFYMCGGVDPDTDRGVMWVTVPSMKKSEKIPPCHISHCGVSCISSYVVSKWNP